MEPQSASAHAPTTDILSGHDFAGWGIEITVDPNIPHLRGAIQRITQNGPYYIIECVSNMSAAVPQVPPALTLWERGVGPRNYSAFVERNSVTLGPNGLITLTASEETIVLTPPVLVAQPAI
jgi:hypothetical protein